MVADGSPIIRETRLKEGKPRKSCPVGVCKRGGNIDVFFSKCKEVGCRFRIDKVFTKRLDHKKIDVGKAFCFQNREFFPYLIFVSERGDGAGQFNATGSG